MVATPGTGGHCSACRPSELEPARFIKAAAKATYAVIVSAQLGLRRWIARCTTPSILEFRRVSPCALAARVASHPCECATLPCGALPLRAPLLPPRYEQRETNKRFHVQFAISTARFGNIVLDLERHVLRVLCGRVLRLQCKRCVCSGTYETTGTRVRTPA